MGGGRFVSLVANAAKRAVKLPDLAPDQTNLKQFDWLISGNLEIWQISESTQRISALQ